MVKLFINRQAIDFNDAKSSEAVQTLEYNSIFPFLFNFLFYLNRFEKKHLGDGSPVEVRFVKFQSVQSLSVKIINHHDY
jgi:hypothetical protein